MDVVVVPTNRPVIRKDFPDVVYRTEKGKFYAVVEEIAEKYERGQPVLVGTISIEKSERLSQMLKEPRLYLPRLEMRLELFKKASQKQQGPEWERLRKLLERPAQLKDEEIAAVLNHIATAWGDAKKVKGFKPFTAEEVKKLRAKKLTPQQVLAERKKLGLK